MDFVLSFWFYLGGKDSANGKNGLCQELGEEIGLVMLISDMDIMERDI